MTGPATYAIHVASGTAGTSFTDTSTAFSDFVVGQKLWLSYSYQATRSAGVSTVTVAAQCQWYDSSSALLSTTTGQTVTIGATVGWTRTTEDLHIPPANAVTGTVQFIITPSVNPIVHDLWVTTLRLAPTQIFATSNNVTYSSSAPTSPTDGDIWVDTSVSPNLQKIRVAGAWQVASNYTSNTNQLTDGANLGGTAAWTGITAMPANVAALIGTEIIDTQTVWNRIANDDVLSASEKRLVLIKTYADMEARYIDLVARATTLAISTTATSNARTNWKNLLATYSPAWNDTSADTTIFTNAYADKNFPTGWTTTSVTTGASGINTTLQDSSASVAGKISRARSQTAAATQYSFQLIIDKDAVTTRFPRIEFVSSGGTGKTGGINLNTSTGVTGGSSNLGSSGVLDLGDDWLLYATFTTTATDTTLTVNVYPAFTATISATTATVATTGTITSRSPRLALGAFGKLGSDVLAGQLNDYSGALTTLLSSISAKDSTLADVQVAGSGVTVGDSRNVPPIITANLSYTFTGAITYTTTTTSISISVGAGNLVIGSNSIAYSAMGPLVVSSLVSGSVHTWYLYVSASGYTAGAHTLLTTETNSTVYSDDNNVYIGTVGPVTIPTSGTGGGGGFGGGGSCPWAEAFVHTDRGWIKAHEVRAGDRVRVLTKSRNGLSWETVESNSPNSGFCYTITALLSGYEVTVSESTPITLKDGSIICVEQIDGHELPVERDGKIAWEPCAIRERGILPVAHIKCHMATYVAGDVAGRGIATHNPKP